MSGVQRIWRASWPVAAAALTGLAFWVLNLGRELELNPNIGVGVALLDFALGIVAVTASAFRHRAPVIVGLIVAVAAGFSAAAGGAWVLTMISLATRRRAREILPVAVVGVASVTLTDAVPALHRFVVGSASDSPLAILILSAAIYAVLIVIGVAIGSRRAELDGLRREAATLREQSDSLSAQARLAERSRIAAELHDELGHRLAVIAVHSAALDYRTDLSEANRKASVAAICDATSAAMTDLRRTLAMLADDPADDPSPLLSERLDQLFDHTRAAEYPLTVHVDPAIMADQAPRPELRRHVLRITQECLTNAIRHAPRQPIDVSITGGSDGPVHILVRNQLPEGPTPNPGSGMGIPGIAERVRLVGGQLTVRPSEDGEFIVEAVLP